MTTHKPPAPADGHDHRLAGSPEPTHQKPAGEHLSELILVIRPGMHGHSAKLIRRNADGGTALVDSQNNLPVLFDAVTWARAALYDFAADHEERRKVEKLRRPTKR